MYTEIFKKIFISCAVAALFLFNVSYAGAKEVIKEYHYTVSHDDSRNSARAKALEQLKILTLEEVGVYVESMLNIKTGSDDQEVQEEINTLTAGIVQVTIIDEKYDGEIFYIKVKMIVDEDEIKQSIDKLLEARAGEEKIAELHETLGDKNEEISGLNDQVAYLRQQLEDSKKGNSNISNDYAEGLKYYFGDGVKQDYGRAFAIFNNLAHDGHVYAQHAVGIMYKNGYGVKQDYKKAVEWYQKAALQGYADAQYNLGWMYNYGLGVRQDYGKAVEWYKKAAIQGHATAQNDLGLMYAIGQGVTQDYKKAVEWYEKAANQGDGRAQLNLGLMYVKGQGVTQDYKKAVEWYEKAALQGSIYAQYDLGFMYANGQGVIQNYKKAFEWYEKAAIQGLAGAQFQLGGMYAVGQGVTQDYKKTVEWFEKAANQGLASAQHSLGYMYENGYGVTQDYKKAADWYQKAGTLLDVSGADAVKLVSTEFGTTTLALIDKGEYKLSCDDSVKLFAMTSALNKDFEANRNANTTDNMTLAMKDFELKIDTFGDTLESHLSDNETLGKVLDSLGQDLSKIFQISIMQSVGVIDYAGVKQYINITFCGVVAPAGYIDPLVGMEQKLEQ